MSTLVQSGYTDYYEYDASHKEGYHLDQKSVLQEIQDNYESATVTFQRWQNEANRDIRSLSGDQNAAMPTQSGPFMSSPPQQNTMTFNRLLRADNMIGGHQRKNRLQSVVIPEHTEAQEGADQLSKVLEWTHNRDDTYSKISRCFDGSRATGLALHAIWIDKSEDAVSGNICSGKLAYNQLMMDPYWEDPSLRDCKWLMFRRWVHRSFAADSLPDLRREIMQVPATGGQSDQKFLFMPYAYNYAIKGMVSWDEFWQLETRSQTFLKDSKTGEELRWKLDDHYAHGWERASHGAVKVIKRRVPTIRRTILVSNKPLYTEVRPWGLDRYPFVPYLCYFYPELVNYADRFQGVVRVARDAQTMYNRRRTANLAILESQIDSGIKFKEGALVKSENAFVVGPGRMLVVAKNASMDDVQTINPPGLNPSSMENEASLGHEVSDLMCISEELLGISDDKDISGLLSKLRQGAALTTLQGVFDNLNYSQKQVGEIFLDLIQNNFTGDKIKKILNAPPVKEFYNKDFKRYSCDVVQAAMTDTQKQLQFMQLVQLQQITGVNLSEHILEAAQITGKNKVMETYQKQQQQAAQAMQQQQALQVRQADTAIAAMQAKALLDASGATERDTRSVSNMGLAHEREAQAYHDRAEATLANARTAKEIEGMEQSQLIEAISFLEARQKQEKEESMAEMQSEANQASVKSKQAVTTNPEA